MTSSLHARLEPLVPVMTVQVPQCNSDAQSQVAAPLLFQKEGNFAGAIFSQADATTDCGFVRHNVCTHLGSPPMGISIVKTQNLTKLFGKMQHKDIDSAHSRYARSNPSGQSVTIAPVYEGLERFHIMRSWQWFIPEMTR